ncbi:unnamed protein product [Mucor fragilis]
MIIYWKTAYFHFLLLLEYVHLHSKVWYSDNVNNFYPQQTTFSRGSDRAAGLKCHEAEEKSRPDMDPSDGNYNKTSVILADQK